jgi:hypothetical protein
VGTRHYGNQIFWNVGGQTQITEYKSPLDTVFDGLYRAGVALDLGVVSVAHGYFFALNLKVIV